MSEPRKRTRVACDTCRKKKIRCDGKPRCLNCDATNEPACHYDERPASRPRVLKPPRKERALERLERRIKRLELMFIVLGSKLGGSEEFNQILENPLASLLTQASSQSEADFSDSSLETLENPHDHLNDASQPHKRILPRPAKRERGLKSIELYYGTHSFLSILSKSSMEWMSQQLGPENGRLLDPLRNIPVILQKNVLLFLKKWIDPPLGDPGVRQRMMNNPFPDKESVVMTLLEKHSLPLLPFWNIRGNTDEIHRGFVAYYKAPVSVKPTHTLSKLLKMNISLLSCLNQSPLSSSASLTPDNSSAVHFYSADELHALQDELLTFAVVYYHKLCLIGEGIETVEAFLMFAEFLGGNSVVMDVDYMILGLAIRQAQSLGLHRIESYETLTPAEAEHYKIVWWACSYMDMELCYRNGKCPTINQADVSFELQNVHSKLTSLDKEYTFFTEFEQIRRDAYWNLFAATATVDTFEAVRDKLDMLNRDMFQLALQQSPKDRPLLCNDPGFVTNVDCKNELGTIKKLLYYLQLMVMNRMPLMVLYRGISEQEKAPYKELSLSGARSILHLMKDMNRKFMFEAYSTWFMFFPLTAFLHLLSSCLNYPESPDSLSDLNLMIESCKSWDTRRSSSDRSHEYFSRMDIVTLVTLVTKIMLRITITIYEKRGGSPVLRGNDSLALFLDVRLLNYPELFQNPEDMRPLLMMSKVTMNAKSPFHVDTRHSPVLANVTSSRQTPVLGPETSNGPVRRHWNEVNNGGHRIMGSNTVEMRLAEVSGHDTLQGPEDQNFTDEKFQSYSQMPDLTATMNPLVGGTHGDDVNALINSQLNLFPNFFFDLDMHY